MAKVFLTQSHTITKTSTTIISPPRRKILDAQFEEMLEAKSTPAARKKSRSKGVGGTIPKPLTSKKKREFIGVQIGNLVKVRGHRDSVWVVISEPAAKMKTKKGEEMTFKSHTRRVGKAAVSVTLMGQDGLMIDVPIGWCQPFNP